MGAEARFVVETHAYVTTLYRPKGAKSLALAEKGLWTGLNGEVEPFDNSALCLRDMERYGVDMCILKPSVIGTTNEMQVKLVERHPDKFRAMCNDQTLKIKAWRGEAEWTVDAACEEIETSLRTGKFVGIGEYVPKNPDNEQVYSFRERLDEYRRFMDLAAKYNVTIDWREFTMRHGWDPYHQLSILAREYPEVSIIVLQGGHTLGMYAEGADVIRKVCRYAGMGDNIYLETGTWPAEYFQIPLKNPNVGATQLVWGGNYGNAPQYITAHPGGEPSSYSTVMFRWPRVPSYHTDWWGWSLHQIRRIREWVTQDEVNLILGGNAAKIFKLPVPYERMFPEGRPDLYGIHWQQSIPFIPKDQVQHPDY